MTSILLVDDQAELLAFMTRALIAEGYSVAPASSGVEALALVRDGFAVDLVVTDWHLSGMNGSELVRQLRGELNVKVVYVSGDERVLEAEPPLMDGGVGFLPKPFSRRELVGAIQRLCGARVISNPQ